MVRRLGTDAPTSSNESAKTIGVERFWMQRARRSLNGRARGGNALHDEVERNKLVWFNREVNGRDEQRTRRQPARRPDSEHLPLLPAPGLCRGPIPRVLTVPTVADSSAGLTRGRGGRHTLTEGDRSTECALTGHIRRLLEEGRVERGKDPAERPSLGRARWWRELGEEVQIELAEEPNERDGRKVEGRQFRGLGARRET